MYAAAIAGPGVGTYAGNAVAPLLRRRSARTASLPAPSPRWPSCWRSAPSVHHGRSCCSCRSCSAASPPWPARASTRWSRRTPRWRRAPVVRPLRDPVPARLGRRRRGRHRHRHPDPLQPGGPRRVPPARRRAVHERATRGPRRPRRGPVDPVEVARRRIDHAIEWHRRGLDRLAVTELAGVVDLARATGLVLSTDECPPRCAPRRGVVHLAARHATRWTGRWRHASDPRRPPWPTAPDGPCPRSSAPRPGPPSRDEDKRAAPRRLRTHQAGPPTPTSRSTATSACRSSARPWTSRPRSGRSPRARRRGRRRAGTAPTAKEHALVRTGTSSWSSSSAQRACWRSGSRHLHRAPGDVGLHAGGHRLLADADDVDHRQRFGLSRRRLAGEHVTDRGHVDLGVTGQLVLVRTVAARQGERVQDDSPDGPRPHDGQASCSTRSVPGRYRGGAEADDLLHRPVRPPVGQVRDSGRPTTVSRRSLVC